MPKRSAEQPDRPDRLIFTTPEAAARLYPDLSPRTMERWRQDGYGPAYVKIGRRVGYTQAALDAWIAQQARTFTSARQ